MTKRQSLKTRTGLSKGLNKPVVVGQYEIELDGNKIKYVLKRSRTAKLIWLKIRPETGLTVTVPSFYNTRNLREYLVSRSTWIQRNLEKYYSLAARPISEPSNMPDKIPFLGKYFSLKHNNRTGGFTAVALDTDALNFNFSSSFGEPSRQGMKRWLKEQSTRLISEKVESFGRKMQIFPKRVFIKDQKSLWGSCSARKNLSFNWRLVMVPERVMDYVVIHELCHLKEMSHSKAFWELVAEQCPDWRLHRKWLNEHCYELKAQLSGK